MTILITGANGFVGRQLIAALKILPWIEIIGICRDKNSFECPDINLIQIGDISVFQGWSSLLSNVDVIVHTAGRAHIMHDNKKNYEQYELVNTTATLRLADAAACSGVKQFIFLSTIKVNGEATEKNSPFTNDSIPNPVDHYAKSKYNAELGLMRICENNKLKYTIIRPPLIYGDGVKGNFLLLIKLLSKSLPLPFGAINNSRSLLAANNLISLIVECVRNENAKNEIFLISDNDDLSTTNLLLILRETLKSRSLLIPVPKFFLNAFSLIIGKRKEMDKLLCNLQVDIRYTRERLGWDPPYKAKDEIKLLKKIL